MRLLYAGIIGICIMLIWLGCSDKGESSVDVDVLNPLDPVTYYDTIVIDTIKNIDTVGTKDSVLADTVVTIVPKTDSINWVIITTTTIYDTIFVFETEVESLTIEKHIYEMVIYDTVSSLDEDTISDTVTADVDTLFEIFVTNKDTLLDIIDTMYDSTVVAIDTHFVTSYLLATTSDAAGLSGNVGFAAMDWLALDTLFTGVKDIYPVDPNARIFTYNSSAYILGGDSIVGFTSPIISKNTIDSSIIIGSGFRDISFVSEEKAYITQFYGNTLIVFDPSVYQVDIGIDLSDFVGVDPPLMQCSKVYNNKLYVLCKRDTTARSSGSVIDTLTGVIVILSTIDNSFIKTIHLTKKNPVSMDVMDGYLYVSSAGKKDSADGGIEKIDLTTDSLIGVVLPETDTTVQNFSDIVMVNSTKGYIKVTSPVDGRVDLFDFNPSTGKVGERVFVLDRPSGEVVFDGKYLYVADRGTTNPGVVIINTVNNSVVAGPISMGAEPPNSIAILNVSH